MSVRAFIVTTACIATLLTQRDLCAQDKADSLPRFGQFVTLTSPLNDTQVARVSSLAVRMQAQAKKENREAVLVLEIPPGSSRFGQTSDLARALTSADAAQVKTVAWIPKTVTGNHVLIALACHDIVMDPNAALGDIGRGKEVSREEQDFILSIVDRRRNSRLARGVVLAMMNPSTELLRVQVKDDSGLEEQRFLTSAELQVLRNRGTEITDSQVIKDVGATGLFNATDSQRSGFMVARTVSSRRDVAEIYELPIQSMREEGHGDKPLRPALIAVHGPITPLVEEFVQRQIRISIANDANLLIFDIDSPGGYLISSERLASAIADLDARKVTTVAWIPHEAISGAAVIALGCDQILMRSDGKIGDAGVILETQEGGAFERAPEKATSHLLQFMADLAAKKRRPPALLQAMVDRNLNVFEVTNKETGSVSYMTEYEIEASNEEWLKGAIVPESRNEFLLTLNGIRANELGLAEAPCEDLDELRLRLGIAEDIVLEPLAQTWVDTFVYVLNSGIGGFALITFAILCLYIEMHVPSGFFGILSALFLSLFFWSRYLGGTAGTLELVMFVLGIGLLALEIFVIPGFGVFGVSGILLLIGSLVMASHTFAGMTAGERFNESMSSLGTLAGALATVIAVAIVLNRFLPSIPFLNRLILTPPGHVADEHAPHLNPGMFRQSSDELPVSVGQEGFAASMLRPAGKASFGDQFLDVVSDGAFIEHGTKIEIIQISGKRIVVRPVATEAT
jgi:membrane-bound serine protease (ClpP class)